MTQNPDWVIIYAYELYNNAAGDILLKQANQEDFIYQMELQAYAIRKNSATHTLTLLLGLPIAEVYQYEY